MIRLFLWAAFVIVAAAYVPFAAGVLGYQLAGGIWALLHSSAPFLSQAGDVFTGLVAGLVVAVGARGILGKVPLGPIVLAGLAVGVAHAIYEPLAMIVFPIATGLAAWKFDRTAGFVRAQAIAAAWIALALMLPFPRWATLAFLLGAAIVSTLGIRLRRGA